MGAAESEILSTFVKKELEENTVILLITPPFYLSEPTQKQLKDKFNYLTFNDLVKQPMVAQLNEPTIVHLYVPPGASKAFVHRIQTYKKCLIIIGGYTKSGISYKLFDKLIQVSFVFTMRNTHA